jgi:hypothetical protein
MKFFGSCHNCQAENQSLARLVMPTPDGKQLSLMVCRFCYLQLRRSASAARR